MNDFLFGYGNFLASAFVNLGERTHWVYLVAGLLAAVLSYALYYRTQQTDRNFFRWAFPKSIYFHRSAWLDYTHFLLRPLWLVLIFGPLMISSTYIAEGVTVLLEFGIGPRPVQIPGITGGIIYTIMLFLAFDFGQFISHYLAHRIWFLWEFHKVHHSAQVLVPLTAYRFHPLDDVFTSSTTAIMMGLCKGVFFWWWAVEPEPFLLWGTDIGLLLFYIAGYNLRHTHMWLPFPVSISHIFMSPAQHQLHHSKAKRHWDKNMGMVLSLWDWMFGTLYVPKEKEEIHFGLAGDEDEDYQTLLKMYWVPFKKIITRVSQAGTISPATQRTRKDSL